MEGDEARLSAQGAALLSKLLAPRCPQLLPKVRYVVERELMFILLMGHDEDFQGMLSLSLMRLSAGPTCRAIKGTYKGKQ